MTSQTVYLVSGANRGIGLGLVTALATRANTLVFAGVRDTTNTAALNSLSAKYPGKVEIVQLTSASEEDSKAAASLIEKKAGHLDVVIANAGNGGFYGPAAATPAAEMRLTFEINTLGPLVLFQAVLPLLKKSDKPHFTVISSPLGSIGDFAPFGVTAYGTSKVAVNFIVKSLHHENEDIIVSAISPGWVQTDMGNSGAASSGMEKAPETVEDSVTGILGHLDGATRETKSGKFLNAIVKDNGMPWDRKTEEIVW